MNKINPLYILMFSLVLFLISTISLSSSKSNLAKTIEENKQYMKIANKYNSLKQSWGNTNNIKQKCENILKIANIKNANMVVQGKVIKIEIVNSNLKALDKFMNKILNEKIIIKSFTLTKSSLILKVGR